MLKLLFSITFAMVAMGNPVATSDTDPAPVVAPTFPSSWGEPPLRQVRDYVALAGGYGHGSSTLSKWIQQNMETDIASNNIQYPPDFGMQPAAVTADLGPLPFGYGEGSSTIAQWLTDKALEVYGVSTGETSALASTANELHFPSSWGTPPSQQVFDYVPLAGGYGYGSSTLSEWIQQNIDTDIANSAVQYPPAFGAPPLAVVKDYRPLPFGYGAGSSTIGRWLKQQALEVYGVSADDADLSTTEQPRLI